MTVTLDAFASIHLRRGLTVELVFLFRYLAQNANAQNSRTAPTTMQTIITENIAGETFPKTVSDLESPCT